MVDNNVAIILALNNNATVARNMITKIAASLSLGKDNKDN
jgi:hypothetical protein